MENDLDWNDLKFFLAVARGGGLTPAAQALGTSASTVSRHVDALEARLGVRLFMRQQRGYLLTDEGSALFGQVAEVERATQAVERSRGRLDGGEVSGLIKVATSETLGNHLLAPNLAGFVAQHPRAQVELVVSRHLADLNRREADLALRMMEPGSAIVGADYIAHPLGKVRFGLYATPVLVAAHPDWRTMPYLSWDESWGDYSMGNWLIAQYGGREPLLRANNLQAQYAAACSGLGLVMLPHFLGGADPLLEALPGTPEPAGRDLWIVYHRDLKASRRVQAMRRYIEELVVRLNDATH
ncbi:LysR family transcriptional regulator [Jeongeupia naejangsanensis]|uniref:LysR family transcriptional regulator n=1 Tax=Jeongeupia naejangsanensis TaxID=613195 RepID=A0ABS2BK80_9NEIS|nr:LysR family transcriptional regulator [Jeongeupia naejangsanensis]MBM3115850.1 LysR family transcriptional regulator [Jeongeupia naejangsanensis]